jgi:hypothetical protein
MFGKKTMKHYKPPKMIKFTWELDPQAKELCILDISVLFHARTLICH